MIIRMLFLSLRADQVEREAEQKGPLRAIILLRLVRDVMWELTFGSGWISSPETT